MNEIVSKSRSRWLAGFAAILLAGLIGVLAASPASAQNAAAPKQLPGAAAADCQACHGATNPLPARHKSTTGQKMADCLKCHEQKTPESLSGKLPLSHIHQLNGVTCAKCHADPKKPEEVSAKKCLTCHDGETVSAATAQLKPTNPHNSPHYGKNSDCNICHHEHEKSENYCSQCHKFEFKVP
ncbi:cytochrome c3 family protein [Telmatospirillum siberiense]|uniref:Tetrahaem cytochrome domain-containing protein n=1 Tax=Telmatospirillum siberiense TaxID=382514 RepID=A0A2N3PXH9_9PROT|nr:cytochrome c3 family protein [Telmatospirillum siberiense]PKU25095.1 hypothetical protein CWS72_07775 [Telmatospirillum siberiense]